MLQKINETHRIMFCIFQGFFTFLTGHFNQVYIIIIAFYRPINHVFIIRKFSISYHHVFRPYTIRFFRRDTNVTGTSTSKFIFIISFRTRNSHIFTIIFQDCYVCNILNYIIFLFRSNIFFSIMTAFHTDIIFHPAHFCYIPQFSTINQYFSMYFFNCIIFHLNLSNPSIILSFQLYQSSIMPYF